MIALILLGLILAANAHPVSVVQFETLQLPNFSQMKMEEIVPIKTFPLEVDGKHINIRVGFKMDSEDEDAKLKFRFYSVEKDGKMYAIQLNGKLRFRVEGHDQSSFDYKVNMNAQNPISNWTSTLTRKTIKKEVVPYEDKVYMILDYNFERM